MSHPDHLPATAGEPQARALAVPPQGGALALATAGGPAPRPAAADVIDLRALWHVLVRRRAIVFGTLIAALLVALVASLVRTPIYRSTLMLQIETEGDQVVQMGEVSREEVTGYRANQDFYKTQYQILESRALARRVIDQLGLELEEEDASGGLAAIKSALKQVRDWAGSLGSKEATRAVGRDDLEPEAVAAAKAEEAFLKNLTVEPLRDTRLVRIHYESPSPTQAVEVVNAIASNYIALNLERRYDASSYAKRFLAEQLEQARATLEDAEKRFVGYAREREIVNTDNRLQITLEKLAEMNRQLVKTQGARIEAEAQYQELMATGAESMPGALESKVIQTLKERRAELERTYEENRKLFKPGYPKMQELSQQIAELNGQIERETKLIAKGIKSQYQAKAEEEAKLNKQINELKDEALALQDRSTDYETLKREVQTSRELYDGLLQRMKEVGVAAGIGENNVSIADPATLPIEPYKPNLKLNLAVGLALGLFLGVALAFLLDALDDSVKTVEEAEALVKAPMLSLIPGIDVRAAAETGLADNQLGLMVANDPKSPFAEAARSLRTQLLFSTAEGAPKILHFTSSGAGEGKTTTAVGTAITFAQAGAKVLLIDGDLRNPSLQRVFGVANATGLTNYLASGMEPLQVSQGTAVPRLFVITSGPLPPNPVELLASARMLDLLTLASASGRYVRPLRDSNPRIFTPRMTPFCRSTRMASPRESTKS